MKKHLRRLALPLALMGLLTLLTLPGAPLAHTLLAPHQAHAAPEPNGTELLLIHGYIDTCQGAFGISGGDAHQFFLHSGWTSGDSGVKLVGFGGEAGCDVQINGYGSGCTSPPKDFDGSVNDPLMHLSCELAWYIYQQNNLNGPVDVLAHSMGGLLIRMAIACSHPSPCDNTFPSQSLDVRRVVTVGTPHTGLSPATLSVLSAMSVALGINLLTREVADMLPGSTFMNQLLQLQHKPQGLHGTYWALIGSAGVCYGGVGINCGASGADGLLDLSTTLGMNADLKIAYGAPGANGVSGIAYTHAPFSVCIMAICMQGPYYLSDTNNTAQTRAYVCWQDCNSGSNDINLNNLGGNATFTTRHSLAEMAYLLSPHQDWTYAATNMDSRGEMFSCDGGTIRHIWQNSVGGDWSSEALLQGGGPGFCIGAPTVTENADGRLEVFYIGNEGFLWHCWWLPDGSGWSGWAQLSSVGGGVTLDGTPSVGLNPNGTLDVFAHGSDGNIWHIWQALPESSWQPVWQKLAPGNTTFQGDPVVSVNEDGRLEVFAQSNDSSIWHIWKTTMNGYWANGWNSLGGWFPGGIRVGVGMNNNGVMELFARGTGNNIYHAWQDPNIPGGWQNSWVALRTVSAVQDSNPVVEVNSDGRLEVFATASDGNVWHIWQTGPHTDWNWGWQALTSTQQAFVGDPATIRNSNNGLEVFAANSNSNWYHTFNPGNTSTSGNGWLGRWAQLS